MSIVADPKRLSGWFGGPASQGGQEGREAAQPWWRGALLYHIYPRSFFDANGDGIGDLAGIAERLEHVAALGADAVWLGPFFRSPMADFGYDVADYCAVDPSFGGLGDFDRLCTRAHDLGLKVLLDKVWSHSSAQHLWFAQSRSSRDNPKADWYVWADPAPDGTPPNNWLSVFGGAAWTWEPRRRQYYLHHFLPSQPQLNLRNEAVRRALFEAAAFWLQRGVDGFRLDAVDFYLHDPRLRSNPALPPPERGAPLKPFGLQRHLHDMLHPEIPEFLSEVRNFVAGFGDKLLLGEVSSQPGAIERCRRYVAPGRLDLAYTLGFMKGSFAPRHFAEALTAATAGGAAAGAGGLCWAFSNHDVERAISRWNGGGRDPAFGRLLLALLACLPGAACLYQGEELGLPEAQLAEGEIADPFGKAFWPAYRGRDGSRTPLPWSGVEPHGGFTAQPGAGSSPWLPVPQDHLPHAVERQHEDPDSLLNFSRALLHWRRDNALLRGGNFRLLAAEESLLAFAYVARGKSLACLFNFSPKPLVLPLSLLPAGFRPAAATGSRAEISGERLLLPPHGYLIAGN